MCVCVYVRVSLRGAAARESESGTAQWVDSGRCLLYGTCCDQWWPCEGECKRVGKDEQNKPKGRGCGRINASTNTGFGKEKDTQK